MNPSPIKPRGLMIAGNWKMNQTQRETGVFFQSLAEMTSQQWTPAFRSQLSQSPLQACVFPPFLSLEKAKHLASQLDWPLKVGAQNVHWEKNGAFTGEVSGPMLQEIGIHWAL